MGAQLFRSILALFSVSVLIITLFSAPPPMSRWYGWRSTPAPDGATEPDEVPTAQAHE